MKDLASGPKTPSVSMATEMKRWLASKWLYFAFFLFSASLATAPAPWLARMEREGARVSGQVASQTRVFPPLYGTRVWPLAIGVKQTSGLQVAGYSRTPRETA